MKINEGLRWLKWGIIIALITVAWFFQHEIPTLIHWLRSLGYLAVIGFCLLYCFASLLFLPNLPIILAAGALFGFYWGLVLNLLSALLSAVIAFMISRHVGLAWLSGKKKQQLDGWLRHIDSYGWKSLALCRLVPFLPCAMINYGYGFTQIKTSVFILTSFIFFIPLKVVETYCGYLSANF
ncbi:TPA: VTT domain-containing protein [Legionella bozemanae]|uniref:TVP38/TMEM64 family membrane protein n=1 Tax=Legionella bozemanae TaxID=447 RepID=A0A0W0RY29_LEGBO|nr:VTT domain-containing protein [Legionella bozemanae]KTC75844.1 putative integral inner membrane protein [Legionella bozemanae]STO35533.1 TVP38/TMEM64 family inner membrane protein ydjZ [Legionella bozemanae]